MKKCPFCAEEIQDEAIKCRYCGSELRPEVPPSQPPTPPKLMTPSDPVTEKTYYSDGDIKVTSTRAVLGGKTYAMSNVTSVSIGENKSGAGCGLILVIVGGLFVLSIFGGLIPLAVVGGVLIYAGMKLLKLTTYVVRIGSASGEANALQSKDRAHIQKIVDALNQVIIDRR